MEPVTISQARDGSLTANAGAVRIHSAWNPQREADKFIQTSPAGHTVVIIGAALGYLDRALRLSHPKTKVIAIHLEETLYTHRPVQNDGGIPRWHPGKPETLETFLSASLGETDVRGLRVVEWPPMVQCRPRRAQAAREALAQRVRRCTGNITTTAAFGKMWIRNMLRNFLLTERVAVPEKISAPVVLAASGPSLEPAISILKRQRNRFRLWALSSSLRTLLSAGLTPDLIIAADPGHWARLHTRFCVPDIPVAMPLSGAPLPAQAGPLLLLPQDLPGEDFLLRRKSWPLVPLPSAGTVAATAADLWKRLSGGPLITAGLDLCWYDLRSHARPHTFDSLTGSQSDRLNPHNHVLFCQARKQAPRKEGMLRFGTTFQTYRDWFKNHFPPGRVYRLETEVYEIPAAGSVTAADESFLASFAPCRPNQQTVKPSPLCKEERRACISSLIRRWKSGKNQSAPEIRTLRYYLDPGGVLESEDPENQNSATARQKHSDRVGAFLDKLGRIYEI